MLNEVRQSAGDRGLCLLVFFRTDCLFLAYHILKMCMDMCTCTLIAHASASSPWKDLSRQPQTPKCSVSTCDQQIEHGALDPCTTLSRAAAGTIRRHWKSCPVEMAGGNSRVRHDGMSRVTALANPTALLHGQHVTHLTKSTSPTHERPRLKC